MKIRSILQTRCPDWNIYCPMDDYEKAGGYPDTPRKEVFISNIRKTGESDIPVAYVPSAGMGTSVEMYEARSLPENRARRTGMRSNRSRPQGLRRQTAPCFVRTSSTMSLHCLRSSFAQCISLTAVMRSCRVFRQTSQKGKPVLTISPLEKNRAVRFFSTEIFGSLDEFDAFLEQGRIT